MNSVIVVSLLGTVGLAVVHLFSGKLRFLEGTSRSIWLSMAGGVSVAYVFIHLLPKLAEGQESVAGAVDEGTTFLERHVYLLALLGLIIFYGLERAAKVSRGHHREARVGDRGSEDVFWLRIGSFAIYNVIIGYLLLHRIATGLEALLLFFIAMALHFVVNDYGLREDHKDLYTRIGRWVLAGAVLVGWLVGPVVEIPEPATAVLIAFFVGRHNPQCPQRGVAQEAREPVLGPGARCGRLRRHPAGIVSVLGRPDRSNALSRGSPTLTPRGDMEHEREERRIAAVARGPRP